jgi:hypothetical protein
MRGGRSTGRRKRGKLPRRFGRKQTRWPGEPGQQPGLYSRKREQQRQRQRKRQQQLLVECLAGAGGQHGTQPTTRKVARCHGEK